MLHTFTVYLAEITILVTCQDTNPQDQGKDQDTEVQDQDQGSKICLETASRQSSSHYHSLERAASLYTPALQLGAVSEVDGLPS